MTFFHDAIDYVKRAWTRAEQESRHAQLSTPAGRIDARIVVIFVVAMINLSLLNYYGSSSDWTLLEPVVGLVADAPDELLGQWFQHPEYGRLMRLGFWSGTTVIGYLLIPLLLIRFVFGDRLRDYGLNSPIGSAPFGLCLGLFLIMLPFVVGASFTDDFQSSYPFYNEADRSVLDFFLWQLIYAAQFLALEFFYRGFLIHGLKHRFGAYAILVSTIPYVMIHFGKPLPETLGSIIAGIALGAMSYHLRSIWPGVFLHIAIALSMDAFSLGAQGRIGLF